MEYRLWDCAELSIVSMTVGGRKHHRSLLMRATEQVDVVRLRPDHQMQNLLKIVGSSLQVLLLPILNLKRTSASSVYI